MARVRVPRSSGSRASNIATYTSHRNNRRHKRARIQLETKGHLALDEDTAEDVDNTWGYDIGYDLPSTTGDRPAAEIRRHDDIWEDFDDEEEDYFAEEEPHRRQPSRPNRTGETADTSKKNSARLDGIVGRIGKVWATNKMQCGCIRTRPVEIFCIGWMESERKVFSRCECKDWFSMLVLHGYFPASALMPQTAIAIDVLTFSYYQSTRGSFSKDGFALGLQDMHRHLLLPVHEPNYSQSFMDCLPFFHRARKCRDDYVRGLLAKKAVQLYSDLQRERPDEMTDIDNTLVQAPPKPLTFEIGSYEELCPSCFYRPFSDDKDGVTVALDGNFQHRRRREAAKNASHFFYQTSLFFEPPLEMVRQANFIPPKEETLCSSNFRATAAKPSSLIPYDETGVLAIVCRFVIILSISVEKWARLTSYVRHDSPLRFMNLHAGERLLWVTDFVEKTIKGFFLEGLEIGKMILMYDIACQLDAFINHKDHGNPFLVEQLEVVVNKFHGYAHEFRCHERWGAHQKKGVGESDGEGVERLWSFLRPLVTPGYVCFHALLAPMGCTVTSEGSSTVNTFVRKTSSPANRKLFIEIYSLRLAQRKRYSIGKTLTGRYATAELHRSVAADTLQLDVLGRRAKTGESVVVVPALAHNDLEGGGGDDDEQEENAESDPIITTALLRKELRKRIAYFKRTTPLAAHDYVTVYDALLAEKEMRMKIEKVDDDFQNGLITADQHTALLNDFNPELLSELEAKTLALIRKYKQDPDDWKEGGELWRRAAQKRNPDQKIYDRLVLQHKAEKELRSAESMPNGALKRQRVAAAKMKLKKQKDAVSKVMQERGTSPSLWDTNSVLFEKFALADVTRKLEHIYRRILQNAAGRSMQLRELKARSSGHNNSAKLVRDVQRAYPGIAADIVAFNKLARTIKDERIRPHDLSMAAFISADDDNDVGEKARESLFALHLLRTTALENLEDRVHDISNALWVSSALVRVGIRQLSRWERALEEIAIVKREWTRMTLYAEQFLRTLLAYLDEPGATCKKEVAYMLWDEMPTADDLVRSREKLEEKVPHSAGDFPIPPTLQDLLDRAYIKTRLVIFEYPEHVHQQWEDWDGVGSSPPPDRRSVVRETASLSPPPLEPPRTGNRITISPTPLPDFPRNGNRNTTSTPMPGGPSGQPENRSIRTNTSSATPTADPPSRNTTAHQHAAIEQPTYLPVGERVTRAADVGMGPTTGQIAAGVGISSDTRPAGSQDDTNDDEFGAMLANDTYWDDFKDLEAQADEQLFNYKNAHLDKQDRDEVVDLRQDL
ncbi:hypothetical protein BJ508DRAFT_312877 [Ascobolus immersus RN42]|uniref:CxC1-like cysteine cluster associated with KDZ transposases domain-containing protein n=1 Tax=Ascobolus immersus RN42 TaxID=1160509 RepID=A0A3N4HRM2_ASCIM|nr:hypothetical protein BJ508DRAFT_312877 [Ascobolus immersus RN42]